MQKRLKAKEINFLKATDSSKEEVLHEKNRKTILAAVPLILLLIVVGVSVVYMAQTYGYNKKADRLQTQLDAMDASANAGNVEEKDAKYSELVAAENQLQAGLTLLKKKQEVNKGTMSYLIGATGSNVKIRDISFEDSVITVNLVGENYREPPLYVQRIRKTGAFKNLVYSGFTKDEAGYNFSIQVELNQMGGADEEVK